jgi:HlyD family secretion protein
MKKLSVIGVTVLSILLFGCGNGNEENFIEESGTIETVDVTISSQTSGKLSELIKREGDKIKKNDTLAVIEHKKLLHQLEQAEAAKAIAKSQLDLVLKGARQEDIAQAEEMVRQAEVNFDLAKKEFDRVKNLYRSKSISKQKFDNAKTRFEVAESQLSSARKNLEKVRNIARPEEVEQAKAKYRQAEANANLLREQLNDAYITSPINGRIVNHFMEAGELVSPMSSLFKVSNLNLVELTVYVQETKIGRVKLGQKAEITVDSYPDKVYEGKVTYISPEAEFTPKNIQTKEERTKLVFAVKIEIPNPEEDLKAGMPADAQIHIN